MQQKIKLKSKLNSKSLTRTKSKTKTKQPSNTNFSETTTDDDEYIENFKASTQQNPQHPQHQDIQTYFENAVDLNYKTILHLKKQSIFNINDKTSLQEKLEANYNNNNAVLKAPDPENWMRHGGPDFRKREVDEEFIKVLKQLETDYKFFPKTFLELGAGQGRMTKALNKFYEDRGQEVVIDAVEPFEPMMQFLRKKQLSMVRDLFVRKAEDFFCESPTYDLIFGFFLNVYIPDKDLIKFYVMVKSCLRDGGIFLL